MKRILSILLCVALLLACQPTPEQDIVINRTESDLSALLTVTAAPTAKDAEAIEQPTPAEPSMGSYSPEGLWDLETPIHERLTLSIHVPIEYDASAQLAAYYVSYPEIDTSLVASVLNAVFPDLDGLREQAISYGEYAEDLLKIDRGNLVDIDDQGEAYWEPYAPEEKDALVRQVMSEMEKVPKEATYRPFTAENLPLNGSFVAHRENGGHVWASSNLYQTNGQAYYLVGQTIREGTVQTEAQTMEIETPGGPGPITGIAISQEEAERIGTEVITRMGRSDFGLGQITKARMVASGMDWGKIASVGWYMEYTPTLPGTMPCAYFLYEPDTMFSSSVPYAPSWPQEVLRLYVTENGVESFEYLHPHTTEEAINDNVQLLSIDEVRERITRYFSFGYKWTSAGDYGLGNKIIVTRCFLTSALTPAPGQPDKAVLLPAWGVFYIAEKDQSLHMPEHLLLINAIDGSMLTW